MILRDLFHAALFLAALVLLARYVVLLPPKEEDKR